MTLNFINFIAIAELYTVELVGGVIIITAINYTANDRKLIESQYRHCERRIRQKSVEWGKKDY